MPLVSSAYRAPWWLRSGHLQTIYPARFRAVPDVVYTRTRINTPDDDFLDLDLIPQGQNRAVILSHGLEGTTGRSYMRGMARAFAQTGWDVVAWNFRGCSGVPNRQLRFYHSGATDDLETVVQHTLAQGYEKVALVGFSLGGNLTLKYLGERGSVVDPRICGAVVFSVPCDLAAGAAQLAQRQNRLYMHYFLRALHDKVQQKMALFPGALDDAGFDQIRTFQQFDDRYTAPLHGFRDALDYWTQCSSRRFLRGICRPTLLVSAADDPFLPPAAYPEDEARTHAFFHLEVPEYGGHVGFMPADNQGWYWSERRAVAFLSAV